MTAAAAATAAPTSLKAHVYERLTRALGPEAAARYAGDAMRHLQLDDLKTPNDLLGFADYLIAQGGVPEAVGRALRITALLRGAGR